ncbi:hypothetical protein GCM10011383_00340 [Hymenobacter cavernae]|uniref:Uncharacterized protein n=1 Tax=Hymenobacter cavernae TaxID=2044852 RepID=A0ABQ1TEL4_9BACT|nr:hypothetical protein GCM10011383_00340 [Hymenobacter cavernae]
MIINEFENAYLERPAELAEASLPLRQSGAVSSFNSPGFKPWATERNKLYNQQRGNEAGEMLRPAQQDVL